MKKNLLTLSLAFLFSHTVFATACKIQLNASNVYKNNCEIAVGFRNSIKTSILYTTDCSCVNVAKEYAESEDGPIFQLLGETCKRKKIDDIKKFEDYKKNDKYYMFIVTEHKKPDTSEIFNISAYRALKVKDRHCDRD
jgi:hypothetical protein